MKILITGGAGMIGRKLTERLVREGAVGGRKISALTAVDIVTPTPPAAAFPIHAEANDLAAAYVPERLARERPDLVFHLAAIVSGEAEADFEKGYAVNLDGTRFLLDALRREHLASGGAYRPRIVFASSIAVFGAPFPDAIDDDFLQAPMTSYGTQKAIGELLVSDYSRRGIFDGLSIRLPTICVRPGAPNKAASGFFSNIIREPLRGLPAVLPVSEEVRHHHASPRAAIGFLMHAATLDLSRVGPRRALTMPGVSVTVAEQIEALRAEAGEKAVALIRREPDETISRIVANWPRKFDANRARELGFQAESDFRQIIRAHLEDEHV